MAAKARATEAAAAREAQDEEASHLPMTYVWCCCSIVLFLFPFVFRFLPLVLRNGHLNPQPAQFLHQSWLAYARIRHFVTTVCM